MQTHVLIATEVLLVKTMVVVDVVAIDSSCVRGADATRWLGSSDSSNFCVLGGGGDGDGGDKSTLDGGGGGAKK